jgi:hypothetical protein
MLNFFYESISLGDIFIGYLTHKILQKIDFFMFLKWAVVLQIFLTTLIYCTF